MFFFLSFSNVFQGIFPNLKVVKLLLDCDADVNAKNESKSTALHVASNPYNYVGEVKNKLIPFGHQIGDLV